MMADVILQHVCIPNGQLVDDAYTQRSIAFLSGSLGPGCVLGAGVQQCFELGGQLIVCDVRLLLLLLL